MGVRVGGGRTRRCAFSAFTIFISNRQQILNHLFFIATLRARRQCLQWGNPVRKQWTAGVARVVKRMEIHITRYVRQYFFFGREFVKR